MFDKIWHQWLRRPYRLNTIDYGGDGPVVILLHGLASSSANWDQLTPLLWHDYHCISIDLLGFGASPKPQWIAYTMEDHLRMTHAAIRHLHLRQPFILVGHSLGSLLATRYGHRYPRQINRLVLLSPPVYAPLETIKNVIAKQRTSFYLAAYKYLRSNKQFTTTNARKLARILPQLTLFNLTEETWIPFIRSLEQCIEHQTLIADIRQVDAPTDVFYGLRDEVIVPYNVRQLTKLREVTMHPLPVGHAVNKRYARAVAQVLVGTSVNL